MSREKQIEEMAKITAKAIEEKVCIKCEDCKWCGSGNKDVDCTDLVCAEALYNAGYRKQSEVAREIIGEILLNHTPDIDGFFTMHESELAELKKKYTEESGNDDE